MNRFVSHDLFCCDVWLYGYSLIVQVAWLFVVVYGGCCGWLEFGCCVFRVFGFLAVVCLIWRLWLWLIVLMVVSVGCWVCGVVISVGCCVCRFAFVLVWLRCILIGIVHCCCWVCCLLIDLFNSVGLVS